jgi:hypothetical protein
VPLRRASSVQSSPSQGRAGSPKQAISKLPTRRTYHAHKSPATSSHMSGSTSSSSSHVLPETTYGRRYSSLSNQETSDAIEPSSKHREAGNLSTSPPPRYIPSPVLRRSTEKIDSKRLRGQVGTGVNNIDGSSRNEKRGLDEHTAIVSQMVHGDDHELEARIQEAEEKLRQSSSSRHLRHDVSARRAIRQDTISRVQGSPLDSSTIRRSATISGINRSSNARKEQGGGVNGVDATSSHARTPDHGYGFVRDEKDSGGSGRRKPLPAEFRSGGFVGSCTNHANPSSHRQRSKEMVLGYTMPTSTHPPPYGSIGILKGSNAVPACRVVSNESVMRPLVHLAESLHLIGRGLKVSWKSTGSVATLCAECQV